MTCPVGKADKVAKRTEWHFTRISILYTLHSVRTVVCLTICDELSFNWVTQHRCCAVMWKLRIFRLAKMKNFRKCRRVKAGPGRHLVVTSCIQIDQRFRDFLHHTRMIVGISVSVFHRLDFLCAFWMVACITQPSLVCQTESKLLEIFRKGAKHSCVICRSMTTNRSRKGTHAVAHCKNFFRLMILAMPFTFLHKEPKISFNVTLNLMIPVKAC